MGLKEMHMKWKRSLYISHIYKMEWNKMTQERIRGECNEMHGMQDRVIYIVCADFMELEKKVIVYIQ